MLPVAMKHDKSTGHSLRDLGKVGVQMRECGIPGAWIGCGPHSGEFSQRELDWHDVIILL